MRLKILAIALGLVLAVPIIGAVLFLFFLPPRVAGDIATLLAERTGQAVELGSLRWSFTPRLHLEGTDLVVGSEDLERPLIEVRAFTLDADVRSLLSRPRHVREVTLDGLIVHVPRGRRTSDVARVARRLDLPTQADGARASGVGSASTLASPSETSTPLVVERVVAETARVEIASTRPNRPSRVYDIQRLTLGSVALDRPIAFQASLTNPTPPGQVETQGALGPWNKQEPRKTPIEGTFDFQRADLAVFRGIEGILTATGTFEGALDQLHVRGTADIPDFAVSVGQVVPLQTTFEVDVGDKGGVVELQPVHTRFFESELVAVGAVSRVESQRGRLVSLDVTGSDARVEDLIKFGLRSDTSPLTGAIDLETSLEIPPGDDPVIDRMTIAGQFTIRRAQFSNLNVQQTLARISQIGRGSTDPVSGTSVVSDLAGDFVMEEAAIRFSRVTFSVPGMDVQLVGSYGLRDQALDFQGRLLLEKSVSEMAVARGARGRLAEWLAIVDPLLQQGGGTGTIVPITIRGTRAKPSFRVDRGALKLDWRKVLTGR